MLTNPVVEKMAKWLFGGSEYWVDATEEDRNNIRFDVLELLAIVEEEVKVMHYFLPKSQQLQSWITVNLADAFQLAREAREREEK